MKRPTIYLLILCALLSTTRFYGQELSISGFVDDSRDIPISYANILLMKSQDSMVVKGVSTDENGFFLLKGLSQDSYLLKVSFLGFMDVYKSVTLSETVDLGTIILEEDSEQLNEINIIAKRPTLKKEPDRLVFNIENTALTEGNMFQVLKSTPGILVMENSIQVKNSTPTIYINDKKVHLSNDDLVQLLEGSSANNIKSIEVITNPSAKYEAESGAVINIVMSKNLITGYRGNVFANYTQGVFPRYDAGMSHFFKNEKIDFFANYTYSQDKINRDQEDIVNYLDASNDISETYRSNINRNTWSKTHNFNFNFDYTLNSNNSLSLSSNVLYLPYFKYLINNHTDVFGADQVLDFYINTNNISNDDKYNLGFNLDYVHRFATDGEKLSVSAHYTTYNYERNQIVNSGYYDADTSFLFSSNYRTGSNQDTEILTSQADYKLPIGTSSNFETGVKMSSINNKSDISYFDIAGGIEINDPNNTNAFDYDENIIAAYVNYSKDWEKFSLIAGLRMENTSVKGVSIYDNVTNKEDYLELFPTASLSYTFSENYSLYTNYKRSIERPDYQSLNPFKFFLNDFTIVSGNPNLQPVFVDHVVMGTSFYHYFIVEAYYKSYKNNSVELPRQDNSTNIVTYTPLNIDKTTEYGFDFLVHLNVTKRWFLYAATSFYNTKDEGVFDGIAINEDQWSNFSQLSNDFTLLKDNSLSANLILTYGSKNLQVFKISEDILLTELSISKSILDKKGNISLTVSDLFNTQEYRTRTKYLNQNSSSITNLDTRYIKLGFRYKFGNTRLETNQRTKEQQETDRLEKKGD